MQKKSRFLTGLLSAVMALTLFALPATAAGDAVVADPTKNPTIIKNVGSLTIEKYEGKENEFNKPFPGIGFTIYKVADIKQNYNEGSKQIELQYKSLVNGLEITSDTKYDEATKAAIDAAVKADDLEGTTRTTALIEDGKKAVAKFDNLAVGVYLVVETYAPSQVVKPSANFLVSIPMTSKDGDDWVYDVVAQPKNETVYGGVTLIKQGKRLLADDKNSEETVDLAGVTFELQEKKGGEWKKVDECTTGNGEKDTTLGQIHVEGLAPGTYRFVETKGVDGYIADGETAHEFTVGNDGKINGEETHTITVTNEKPDLDKTVKQGEDKDGNAIYGTDADYSVGDMVEWKVSVSVPSNIAKLKTFKVVDEMSEALTWKPKDNDLKVVTDTGTELTASDDYTLDAPQVDTEGATWTITVTNDGKAKLANVKRIDITFKTELNDKAKIGEEDNLNQAELKYSNAIYPENDPQNPNNGKTPGEDVIHDVAIVYTFKLDAVKVDGSDVEKKLPGAKFDLYRYKGTEGNPTEAQLKDNSDHIGKYVSDENGKLNISGLKKGNYYLVETEAPTYKDKNDKVHHYNLLKEPVKVIIQPTYKAETKMSTVTNADGVTTTTKEISEKKYSDGNAVSGHFVVTIKNNKGFELPVTGGFGTLLFSGIGALLVVGGVGVLMGTKKKKDNA